MQKVKFQYKIIKEKPPCPGKADLRTMIKKAKYTYDWPRPMVTVDTVVFGFSPQSQSNTNRPKKVKLLLINRKNQPFKGKWALPGGFVELDEELKHAAIRELTEETSLENVPLEQMHTFGKCGRDPRGRQITIVFMGIVTQGLNKIKAGDDAAKAQWFDIEKLPEDLAFDHNEVANMAIRKLKRKKIYRQNP